MTLKPDLQIADFVQRRNVSYVQLLTTMALIYATNYLGQPPWNPNEPNGFQSGVLLAAVERVGFQRGTYRIYLGYVLRFLKAQPGEFTKLLHELGLSLEQAKQVVDMFNHAGYPVQFDATAFRDHGAASALSSGQMAVTHRDLVGDTMPGDESGLQLVSPSPKFQLVVKFDIQDVHNALQRVLPLLSADLQRTISETLTAKDIDRHALDEEMQQHGMISDDGLNRALGVFYNMIQVKPTCLENLTHFLGNLFVCGKKQQTRRPRLRHLCAVEEAWLRTFQNLQRSVRKYATEYVYKHEQAKKRHEHTMTLPLSNYQQENNEREFALELFERHVNGPKPAIVTIKTAKAADNHRRYCITIPSVIKKEETNRCRALQWERAVNDQMQRYTPKFEKEPPASFVPKVTLKKYDYDDEQTFSRDFDPSRKNGAKAAKQTSSNEVVTPADKDRFNDFGPSRTNGSKAVKQTSSNNSSLASKNRFIDEVDPAARCQPSTSRAPPADDYSQYTFDYGDYDYNDFDYNDFGYGELEEVDPALLCQPSTSRGPLVEDDVDDEVAATPEDAALEEATEGVTAAIVDSLLRAGCPIETIQSIMEGYVRRRREENR